MHDRRSVVTTPARGEDDDEDDCQQCDPTQGEPEWVYPRRCGLRRLAAGGRSCPRRLRAGAAAFLS